VHLEAEQRFPHRAFASGTPPPPTRSEQDASGENGGDRASIRNNTRSGIRPVHLYETRRIEKKKNKTRLEGREEGNKTRGLYEAFPERFDSFVRVSYRFGGKEGKHQRQKTQLPETAWIWMRTLYRSAHTIS
jgi:hypothetical protein